MIRSDSPQGSAAADTRNAGKASSALGKHSAGPLIEASGLTKDFPLPSTSLFGKRRTLRAVADVDLAVWPGETVALVGESGSGKSTLGRMLLRLIDVTDGRILYGGRDITHLRQSQLTEFRREAQIVFQSPYSSLNPRKTIRRTLAQPLKINQHLSKESLGVKLEQLMESVGLLPPKLFLDRYPHALSGGQRQRVGIARAISNDPRLIVADEPLSALDMSVQVQILRLMQQLQADLGVGYLLITHDLNVARAIADRVVVLYLGQVVEQGPAHSVLNEPRHPYTRSLVEASPIPDPVAQRQRNVVRLVGEVPSPIDRPAGCAFHTRCPFFQPGICDVHRPTLTSVRDDHPAACLYWPEIQNGELAPHPRTPQP